jgi:AraC family transcriptional regulator of adaptative response / DNA-3-methyladenine glycosylase II
MDTLPDDDGAYQALLARDARFDGRLFVGVSSTGIYCRPICRVRTPQRAHCRFFASAARAEAAAFRPCLKCRPELAPGPGLAWSVMDASRTLARQAAELLDLPGGGDDRDTAGVAALAARLGISDRHLRRIFQAEHGVTPLQYAQTRRLLLAKQLLTDTELPVTQVALASGFRSLRRFHAAFAEHYRLSPSRLRSGRRPRGDPPPGSATDPGVSVQLCFRPPYERAALLGFFAERAIPGIEQVGSDWLRRSLRAGALAPAGGEAAAADGWLALRFLPEAARVQLSFASSLLPHSAALIAAVRRWLDLDAQPTAIDAALQGLPGPAGLRLPGSLDGFELAVRAVLGQQVSVAAARSLAVRLVGRFGRPVDTPWPEVQRVFPQPTLIADLPPEAIAELGIIRSRAGAIIALAQAWPELQNLLQTVAADPGRLIARLCALPGIGPWTAHYIAMRGLGWPDAFPPGDVAVLKALRLQAEGPEAAARAPKAAALRAEVLAADAQAQAWRPWRSYAVLRLWGSLAAPAAGAPPAPPEPA